MRWKFLVQIPFVPPISISRPVDEDRMPQPPGILVEKRKLREKIHQVSPDRLQLAYPRKLVTIL